MTHLRSFVQCLVLSAAFLAALAAPIYAGPCTAKIDAMQARVDARLEAVAARGRVGIETVGARLHHQPTPESIARAERELNEGQGATQATAALERARVADKNGDAAGCRKALAQVRRWMKR